MNLPFIREKQFQEAGRRKALVQGRRRALTAIAILVLASVCALKASALPQDQSRSQDRQTQADLFKSFVASPPIIESIVIACVCPTNNELGGPDDPDFVLAHSKTSYVFGRLQPGSVLLKRGRSLASVTDASSTPEMMTSQVGTSYTAFDGLFFDIWKDGPGIVTKDRLMPSHVFYNSEDDLVGVMNMGVFHCGFGSVRWSGNKLSAKGVLFGDSQKETITGELKIDADGVPRGMDLEYRQINGRYHYLVEYGYGAATNTEFSFLPRRIEWFFLRGGKKMKFKETRLVSITTNSAPLPATGFDLKGGLNPTSLRLRLYTNGGWHLQNGAGSWVPMRDVPFSPTSRNERIRNNDAYYAVVAGTSFLALGLAFRSIKNKQKQQRENS